MGDCRQAAGDPALLEALGRVGVVTERLVLVAATLLLAAVGLLPVAAMLKETLIADGRFSLDAYRALLASSDHLVLLMSHSLQLAFLTASLSTLIGVPLGVVLGKTDIPWRGALTLVFAAPLVVPSYVLAVAWFSIMGRTGLLGGVLPGAWSREIAAAYIAAGVDPARSTIFPQSAVPEHSQLMWLLATMAQLGKLERMDKAEVIR